jgi:hypothetical protein
MEDEICLQKFSQVTFGVYKELVWSQLPTIFPGNFFQSINQSIKKKSFLLK